MSGRLDGKVAVITGGCGAIGAAITQRFFREGARVAIVDVDAAKWEQLTREHPEFAGPVQFVPADVFEDGQVRGAMRTVVESFGRLDILVATVGGSRDALIHKMSDEQWDHVITLNLRTTFLCCRAAAAHMIEQGSGKIICMSSRSAGGNVGQVNYAAAKAGIIGLTKSLAREMARHRINVNCVAPGFIDSPRLAAMPDKYRQMRIELNPFREAARPEDVADVILFLASDDARQVTGQTIRIASW